MLELQHCNHVTCKIFFSALVSTGYSCRGGPGLSAERDVLPVLRVSQDFSGARCVLTFHAWSNLCNGMSNLGKKVGVLKLLILLSNSF